MTGGTGHHRGRWGLWTIAVACALGLLLDAVQVGVSEVYQTLRATGGADFPRTELAIAGWIDVALVLALSVGLVLHASASRAGRRWFLLAAVLVLVGSLTGRFLWQVIGDVELSVLWGRRIPTAAWLVAGLAFARGVQLSGGADGTALKIFAGVLAAHLLVFLWAELTTPAWTGFLPPRLRFSNLLTIAHVVETLGWLYLVLDRVGAFPAADGAPQAAVRSDSARRFATAASIAFTLAGTGLLAAALWSTRLLGVDTLDRSVVVGIPLLLGGACGLWRLRAARLSLGGVGFGACALVIGTRLILSSAAAPPVDVELVHVQVPGLGIALPDGATSRRYGYREAGSLVLQNRHLDIGRVELAWSNGEEDPHAGLERELRAGGSVTSFSSSYGYGQISYRALVRSTEHAVDFHASWRCPGDARWFTLELSLYESHPAELRALGERVMESARCDWASLAAAPPVAVPFSPPAGYRPIDSDRKMSTWKGPGHDTYSLLWTADGDLDRILSSQPESLLEAFGMEPVVDRIEWLDPIQLGDESRQVAQVEEDDSRLLMTAWDCEPAGISVAAFHVGPSSLPAEPALEVFRSGGCPPETRDPR